MISIGQFEKKPATIIDYYKLALTNPKEFARSIQFDEPFSSSGVIILIFIVIQAVINAAFGSFGSVLAGLVGTFIGFGIGVAVASVIVFVIAKISNAEMNFQQCFNLAIHCWLLSFPLSLLGFLTSLAYLASTILQLVFFVYVLIVIFKAVAVRVYIVTGVFFMLGVLPYACMMMGKAVLENSPQMQEVLQGRSLEEFSKEMQKEGGDFQKAMKQMNDIQKGMEKSEKIMPPCYKSLSQTSKNPVFSLIGVQVQFLGMAPPDKKAEALRKLKKQIDESLTKESKAYPMSAEQKDCLRKIKTNLDNF